MICSAVGAACACIGAAISCRNKSSNNINTPFDCYIQYSGKKLINRLRNHKWIDLFTMINNSYRCDRIYETYSNALINNKLLAEKYGLKWHWIKRYTSIPFAYKMFIKKVIEFDCSNLEAIFTDVDNKINITISTLDSNFKDLILEAELI